MKFFCVWMKCNRVSSYLIGGSDYRMSNVVLIISDLPPFQPGDKNAHVQFGNYVRSFEIFARAAGIKGQQALKDNFLSKAGKPLQDVYFLLPDAKEDPETGKDATPYDDCVILLKSYFKKKTSRTYEKYLLRQIKQAQSEDFQSFLKRIREQAANCSFETQARVDEEILDQIVFGTVIDSLRAELLKTEPTLSQAIDKAMMMEGVSTQLKVFNENTHNVNRIDQANGRKSFSSKRLVTLCSVRQLSNEILI